MAGPSWCAPPTCRQALHCLLPAPNPCIARTRRQEDMSQVLGWHFERVGAREEVTPAGLFTVAARLIQVRGGAMSSWAGVGAAPAIPHCGEWVPQRWTEVGPQAGPKHPLPQQFHERTPALPGAVGGACASGCNHESPQPCRRGPHGRARGRRGRAA